MKTVLSITALMCILALSAPARSDPGGGDLQETIDYIVDFVRSSDVVFIRNNKEHSPEDAASHMLKKYKYAKKKVKTPEDFIEYCATKSTMSGKPYRVRLPDGTTLTSAEWLLAALEDYRRGGQAFEMREFRKQYGSCPTPQEDCASVVIRYPELPAATEDKVFASITSEITRRLIAPVYEGTRPGTYEELADTFIEGYKNTQAGFPDYRLGWSMEREASIVHWGESLVCVTFAEVSFTGGAHPNSKKVFVTFRLSDGNIVKLADLLNKGFEEELTEIGEKAFREARGLKSEESLESAGFWFEDGVFRLNDNFGVTEEGIVFHFGYYEVAPYSMGPTEILITYDQISSLVRSDGPLKGAPE
jgi:hypothetical protein